jgi:hypothetical protein
MKKLLIKSILFTVIYTIFHFAYDVLPLPIFATSESIWEHLKIGYFSAIALSLLELAYYALSKRVYDIYNFILSRAVNAQLIAGILFAFFYLLLAIVGQLPGGAAEVVVVVIMTWFAALVVYYIEGEIYENYIGKSNLLLAVVLVFLVINSYLFIKYSFEVPYYLLFLES